LVREFPLGENFSGTSGDLDPENGYASSGGAFATPQKTLGADLKNATTFKPLPAL
jgi:hypothetical protein